MKLNNLHIDLMVSLITDNEEDPLSLLRVATVYDGKDVEDSKVDCYNKVINEITTLFFPKDGEDFI